jgi:hypothetical protein
MATKMLFPAAHSNFTVINLMRTQRRVWSKLLLVGLIFFLHGCVSLPERHTAPIAISHAAEIPGIPRARFWADEWPKLSKDNVANYTKNSLKANFSGVMGREHHYLAISGRGPRGAYGAGLLVGWSAAGTRPEFTIVTGISTSALTAPFVFLGADYDDKLREVYTTTSTDDVIVERSIFNILFGDAVAGTKPLKTLYIKDDVLQAIAAEHKKGRRLWIGTTNLDAGRPVIRNI